MKYLETRFRDMVEEKLLMGASSESTRTSGLWSRSWHQAISSVTSNKLQTKSIL